MNLLGANERCWFLLQSNESLTYLKLYHLNWAVFDPDETSNDCHLLQRWGPTSPHRLSLDVSLRSSCLCECVKDVCGSSLSHTILLWRLCLHLHLAPYTLNSYKGSLNREQMHSRNKHNWLSFSISFLMW